MVHTKRIGEYCTYLKQYVSVVYRYYPDGTSTKSCENIACGNTDCRLSSGFQGDRSKGKDFLGQPGQTGD